jgi:hypothetical protein
MIFTINFKDFSTKLNFLNLQNKFLSYDERNIGIVEEIQLNRKEFGIYTDVSKQDFYITYKTIELNGDYYEDIFFYKDFLTSNINSLATISINQVILRINKEFRHKSVERKEFIFETIENAKKINFEIFNAIYLPDNIKVRLDTQITLFLNFLYEDDFFKYENVYEKKIKLKMNKNDILTFFTLLKQQKIIKYPFDAELGNLIDNHFLFYDYKSETYKEIKNSNKLLSDYKNGSRTIKKSIERLKNIFTNEEFFILK